MSFDLDHSAFKTVTDDVKISVLPNGLTVVSAKKSINTVTVSVFANVGTQNESEAENGISHFLEHMAFKGTDTRSPKDIVMEVEILGANVNAFTSRSLTAYYVNGLPDHIDPALDILSDVIKNSTLPIDEIEREKDVVVEEIHENNDDIHSVGFDALLSVCYPAQPAGRTTLGSEENVRSFDHDMLSSYLNRYYHAGSLLVMAVGNVDHEAFLASATARFGDIERRDYIQPDIASYVGGSKNVIDTSYDQAHLYVAFEAPGSNSADFARFDLLSDVLGGGMSSPLFQEVREKRGLCYSVSSGMMDGADTSLFIIDGSTTPDKVNDFLGRACGELAKIAAGHVDENDWKRARNQVIRRVISRSDGASGSARTIAHDLFSYGRVRSTDEMMAVYSGVTKEDIVRAAQELIASKVSVAVVGNASDNDDYTPLVSQCLAM